MGKVKERIRGWTSRAERERSGGNEDGGQERKDKEER